MVLLIEGTKPGEVVATGVEAVGGFPFSSAPVPSYLQRSGRGDKVVLVRLGSTRSDRWVVTGEKISYRNARAGGKGHTADFAHIKGS